ncbi:MAG: hypothetical protein IRZ32_18555, partial [Solirubrobacteraceae bacterium]|nr:hypothetical protein [Solirubrobacteraceae bacterium]
APGGGRAARAPAPQPGPAPATAPSADPAGADRRVEATLGTTAVRGRGARRRVVAQVRAGEPVSVRAELLRGGRTLGSATASLGRGTGVVRIRVTGARPGRALLRLTVTDEAGNTATLDRTVRLLRRR